MRGLSLTLLVRKMGGMETKLFSAILAQLYFSRFRTSNLKTRIIKNIVCVNMSAFVTRIEMLIRHIYFFIEADGKGKNKTSLFKITAVNSVATTNLVVNFVNMNRNNGEIQKKIESK